MEIRVFQLDGVKFAVQARSHTILCDQPVENHGTDSGMTPPELLLASLGTCAAFYAAEYLRSRNLSQSGVQVAVGADKLLQPARLGNFRISVQSPVHLSEEQTVAMMRSVQRCLIHNTLKSPPEISIEIQSAVDSCASASKS